MAERFKRIYKQGVASFIEIWVDTETGVNYLWREDGYSGGLTPLLDRDGKVVVTHEFESVGLKIEK
ncbi:MAG: xylan 1,4-beta-xylosidase [Oscillospiraceae bacterium]|nr:xylan 1,4-beta-xylosidase [Oscillospiraceae bacterium]